jgi:mRNA-degrading endonuclease toxin of MazEF toxin-antitoxin module
VIRRGEVWRYESYVNRPGRTGLRLVISADEVNGADRIPVVLALEVLDADPGGLLSVKLDEGSWASALSIVACQKSRMAEHVATADEATMELVSSSLRAVQAL